MSLANDWGYLGYLIANATKGDFGLLAGAAGVRNRFPRRRVRNDRLDQPHLTIIDQKGQGSGAPAVALGVAPTTYTLTGYYEGNGLSGRLSYAFNEGSQASGLNQNGIPSAAIFGRNYAQMDFSGNVDLGKILANDYLPTLVLNVINITKASQSSYFQFSNATFNEYNPGRTILVGVRGRF